MKKHCPPAVCLHVKIIKPGISIDVSYKNGVAVFTQPLGGLMFEASVGGQHFSYKAKD